MSFSYFTLVSSQHTVSKDCRAQDIACIACAAYHVLLNRQKRETFETAAKRPFMSNLLSLYCRVKQ